MPCFCTPAERISAVRFTAAALGIEEKVAIATRDQPVGTAQDRTHLVAKMMVAPVARSYRIAGQELFGDATVGRLRSLRIVGAQIEDVSQLRLLWQGAIRSARRATVQRPPEPTSRIEASFEVLIEHQYDGIDAIGVVRRIDKDVVLPGGAWPYDMTLLRLGPDVGRAKLN